jgi:hypothetical protein
MSDHDDDDYEERPRRRRNSEYPHGTVTFVICKVIGGLVMIVGLAATTKLGVAASNMSSDGKMLNSIQSKAGNTVAEAYYQGVGRCVMAASGAVEGAAFAICAIALGLGGRLLVTDPRPRANGRLIYG